MSAVADLPQPQPTVRFAKRQSRGMLLGLSTLRVALVWAQP